MGRAFWDWIVSRVLPEKPRLPPGKRRKPSRRLEIETLEERRLLSVTGRENGAEGWANDGDELGYIDTADDSYYGTPICIPCQTRQIGSSCPTTSDTASSAAVSAAAISPNSVFMYGSDIVQLQLTPMASTDMGTLFGQSLVWTNQSTAATGSPSFEDSETLGISIFGKGMSQVQMPELRQFGPHTDGESGADLGADEIVAVDGSVTDTFMRDAETGDYTAQFGSHDTLTFNSGEYVLNDTIGNTITFQGFNTTLAATEQGQFLTIVDAGHNTATAYWSGGQLTKVDLSVTSGSVTTTDEYRYSYNSATDESTDTNNPGTVSNVALYRTTSGTTSMVQQVDYTYYGGSDTSFGSRGDLKLAQIRDADGNVLDTTYCRYYTGVPGFDGLSYMFSDASFRRLEAWGTATSTDIFSASNDDVAPYADVHLVYGGEAGQTITELDLQGLGCSACAGGIGSYQYAYEQSGASYFNGDGSFNFNQWTDRTTESFVADTGTLYTNTIYSNFAGETILSVHHDPNAPSGQQDWDTFYHYNDAGQIDFTANPSVFVGMEFDASSEEATPDLVGFSGGTSSFFNSTGLVNGTDYYATTTATTISAGGVKGFVEDHWVQQGGDSSTRIYKDLTTYIGHADFAGDTMWLVASSTVYSDVNHSLSDPTGAQETDYTYGFYADPANYGYQLNQVQEIDTTLPPVDDQGSSGVRNTTEQILDMHNRVVFQKDESGYISYAGYAPGTGAVIEAIQDLDTNNTTEITNLPNGDGSLLPTSGTGAWVSPGRDPSSPVYGTTPLNLVTLDEVDSQGRVVEDISPGGAVTLIAYDDALHETRVFRGYHYDYATETFSLMSNPPPTQVTIDDLTYDTGTLDSYGNELFGTYSENFTMTAGIYSGISGVKSLSVSIENAAGQTVETDDYYSIPSIVGYGYGGSVLDGYHLGTQWTPGTDPADANYYSTLTSYDALGIANRQVNPDGTIYREVHDTLGRTTSTWFGTGTDDTPTTEGDSGRSPCSLGMAELTCQHSTTTAAWETRI